jgi:hypothetical protein
MNVIELNPTPTRRMSVLAKISFVIGLIAIIICLGPLSWGCDVMSAIIPAFLAIIFGIIALVRIRYSRNILTGKNKSIIGIVLGVITCLLTYILFIPNFYFHHSVPNPIKKIFDYPSLGITVHKPKTEDWANWGSISYLDDVGLFLTIKNEKIQASINFICRFTDSTEKAKEWLVQSQKKYGGFFSENMKYEDVMVDGVKAIKEIADHDYAGFKDKEHGNKFYTTVIRHKNYFLVIDSSAPSESFDKLVEYSNKVIALIKLYENAGIKY